MVLDAHTTSAQAAEQFKANIVGKTVLLTGVSKGGLGEETARVIVLHAPKLLILAGRTLAKYFLIFKLPHYDDYTFADLITTSQGRGDSANAQDDRSFCRDPNSGTSLSILRISKSRPSVLTLIFRQILDLADKASVVKAAKSITIPIDILINNGQYGSFENFHFTVHDFVMSRTKAHRR